ncbi:MAG: GTPase ObgE [Epsilonproteobacteria bacterium]|nr:GTPase ObgE [Campylobacterota bacterium]
MFIDRVELTLSSGNGGAGAVSFWTEKFVSQGGPDGGDGGRGGSVYIQTDSNTDTLTSLRGRHHIKAKNGRPGEGRRKYGKSGEDVIVTVPPGTQIFDVESGELLLDMTENNQKVKLLDGGKGGLGNMHFKNSSNQRPTYAQAGLPGVTKLVRFEMKMIADVGLVGYPNVGKSTLISVVSNARPQVADYEFTTLVPSLGVVDYSDYDSFIMADIPGIIEGASEGRGLGYEFLRHIERTSILLFMLDISNYRTMQYQYTTLFEELKKYSDILGKRDYAIAITKIDALNIEECNRLIQEFMSTIGLEPNNNLKSENIDNNYLSYGVKYELGQKPTSPLFVLPISSVSHINTKAIKYILGDIVKMSKESKDANE